MVAVRVPDWLDELDLHAGPPEAAMGTRALDEARWFLVDDDWEPQRDEARRLLDDRRDEVLAGDASSAAACALDDTIVRWLGARGVEVGDGDEPVALARARRRVADDLCLLTPGADGTWILAAGAVCFPSFWRLHEKVGHPLAFVHAPVPGYPGSFAARVDTFLSRLRDGQSVWRRNWSIHRSPTLFVPIHESVPLPPVEERWLRTEYQTLRRLPGVDAIAFTIRTQQVPVGALGSRPDVRARLAGVLDEWTDAQRAYKGSAVDDALLAWLREVSG
jgi:hypothetical protein